MIRLSSLIHQFKAGLLQHTEHSLLPSQRKALSALENCRTPHSPLMQVHCDDCTHDTYLPHSCGHRHCPHCQQHESQQWIEKQCQKQVPGDYFMVTFTVPAQLRCLFYQHQRLAYQALFKAAWSTLQTFSENDKQLQGTPGVIAVLHTHSRAYAYHPHIHAVIPAAAINKSQQLWREKKSRYLFNHKALAKVFRAKLLCMLVNEKLTVPNTIPQQWVVNCKQVGHGKSALTYLGRYLYRGIIREKDILSNENGQVTFRYLDSKTKRWTKKTLPGADFLWLIIKHVLPKGFRRARNYGFLHPNSKLNLKRLWLTIPFNPENLEKPERPRASITCPCCGGIMKIVRTRILPIFGPRFRPT